MGCGSGDWYGYWCVGWEVLGQVGFVQFVGFVGGIGDVGEGDIDVVLGVDCYYCIGEFGEFFFGELFV